MRQCTACKLWKLPQNFAKSSTIQTGFRSICLACAAEKQRAYTKTNPSSIKRTKRLQHLKEYGLTPDTYNAILVRQNNLCAICGRGQKENARLCVDHDHVTGKVRGLLCRHCNVVLGMIEKSGMVLTNIPAYLENNLSTNTRQAVLA